MASWKQRAKLLARSRSLALLRDASAPYAPGVLRSVGWRGMQLHYRVGSSDPWILYEHLMKPEARAEYAPPPEMTLPRDAVRSVLDIGANIGAASLYFSRIFPNARIFAFEPVPDNFAVLQKNITNCARIQAFEFGLGAGDATLELYASDDPVNFGGYSLHVAGSDTSRKVGVRVRGAAAALEALGLRQVDVIKIDTEGAEWDILTALPEPLLAGAALICGELHGQRDFALLDHLSRWFDIGARKRIRSRLFNFYAVAKRVTPGAS
jgi:FkbM family methyltransferase